LRGPAASHNSRKAISPFAPLLRPDPRATGWEAGIDCQISIEWQRAQYSFTQHPS
jgi:hypothetical protein